MPGGWTRKRSRTRLLRHKEKAFWLRLSSSSSSSSSCLSLPLLLLFRSYTHTHTHPTRYSLILHQLQLLSCIHFKVAKLALQLSFRGRGYRPSRFLFHLIHLLARKMLQQPFLFGTEQSGCPTHSTHPQAREIGGEGGKGGGGDSFFVVCAKLSSVSHPSFLCRQEILTKMKLIIMTIQVNS